jgi:DNA-binding transcriptional MerR regulator
MLPAGTSRHPNQIDYGTEHVERLLLIRALREVCGLPVESIRGVLRELDGEPTLHSALAIAQNALAGETTGPNDEWAERRLGEVLAANGWSVAQESAARHKAVLAIAAFRAAGCTDLFDRLDGYPAAADAVATLDLHAIAAADSISDAVREAALGTILGDAYFSALRLLAQQHHMHRRDGGSVSSTM